MNEKDLNQYVEKLLHADENDNSFINLDCGASVFYLGDGTDGYAERFFEVIREQYGKKATIMLSSSGKTHTKVLGAGLKEVDWHDISGQKNTEALENLKDEGLNVIAQKGNNPLFLSLGAICWEIAEGDGLREISSPLIILPIKLVRPGDSATPIYIELVPDRAFINPGFLLKLRRSSLCTYGDFPRCEGDDDIDIPSFELSAYFDRVQQFVQRLSAENPHARKFELRRGCIALSKYKNPDICMYYDITRNIRRIASHPLVCATFTKNERCYQGEQEQSPPYVPTVLPCDYSQKQIIRAAASGMSMTVQGPPGTGKSQTVANIIAAFLAQEKKVLFVSQKIAALTEVYNKLPEQIRNYLLRIDREGESMALKPQKVHDELVAARKKSLSHRRDIAAILAERDKAYADFCSAESTLEKYRASMFDSVSPIGKSFYKLLDDYCATDAPEVEFDRPETVYNVSASLLDALCETAHSVQTRLLRLSENGEVDPRKNPWYGIKPDVNLEQAYADVTKAAGAVSRFCEKADESLLPLTMAQITALAKSPYDSDTLTELKKCDLDAAAPLMRSAAQAVCDGSRLLPLMSDARLQKVSERVQNLMLGCPVGAETADECRAVYAELDFCQKAAAITSADALQNAVRDYADLRASGDELLSRACAVLPRAAIESDVFGEENAQRAKYEKMYAALKKYADTKAQKPGALDFAGKSAYQNALKAATTEFTDLGEICVCLKAANDYYECCDRMRVIILIISKLLRTQLTRARADILLRYCPAAEKSDGARQKSLSARLTDILSSKNAVESAISELGFVTSPSTRIDDIADIYRAHSLCETLQQKRQSLSGLNVPLPAYENLTAAADVIETLRDLKGDCELPLRAIAAIGDDAAEVKQSLGLLYVKYFDGAAYSDAAKYTPADLRHYSAAVTDRKHTDDAIAVSEALSRSYAIDFSGFVTQYLGRQLPLSGLKDSFYRSFLGLYLQAIRNGLGRQSESFTRLSVQKNIDGYISGEKRLMKANSDAAAVAAAAAFNPSAEEFAFLDGKNRYRTCRALFRDKAKQILKIKPCLIMSPSMISQLLGADAYSQFDLVIIDEASQITPECAIPALYRAKQCVIFGDEHQMPVLRHFVRAETDGDDGDLYAAESVLDLMSGNNSFRRVSLNNHYRSVTESLIAYSQARYYPDMITFPSFIPHTEDIGVFDEYVPDGYSDGGANPPEAQRVLSILRRHFDKYYDEKKGALTKSVGVVTFGKAQADKVNALIEADGTLRSAVRTISCGDIPEKQFFVRTIENVQGHEMDAIVLSLTYGRRSDGNTVGTFGQLNRTGSGNLGEKVFNVAVTRAKQAVHLVHSVRSAEITAPSIDYIRDYVQKTERYGHSGFGQSGNAADCGLTESVVRCLMNVCGIPRDRIVIDYGITANSVKIPIAVLSPDKQSAQMGILCEKDAAFDFADYFCKYPQTLCDRGWKLTRIFVYDWIRNAQAEQKQLAETVKTYVTL